MWCFAWESYEANTLWLGIFDHDALDRELAHTFLLEGVSAILVITSLKHLDVLSGFINLTKPEWQCCLHFLLQLRVASDVESEDFWLVWLSLSCQPFRHNLVSMRLAGRCVYFAFIYECLILVLSLAKVDSACNQGSVTVWIGNLLAEIESKLC